MAQKVHLPNALGLDELELLAIAEPRRDLLDRVADHFQIEQRYGSHLELAENSELEAVIVSGHYSGQGEMAADLLRAGKHVLVEKPMATSVEQADRILEAERTNAAGARLMVAYMKRYDPGYRLLRRLLGDVDLRADLGEIVLVRYHSLDGGEWLGGLDTPLFTSAEAVPESASAFPDWLEPARREHYVGYLQQYTHNVNLMRWLLDAGDRVSVRHVDLDSDEYTGIVVLEIGGQRAVLETGMAESNDWDDELQIYFQRGWLKASGKPLLLRNQPVTIELSRLGRDAGEATRFTPSAWRWSYREELRHFAEAIRGDHAFDSPAADTAADVRVFEEIFRFPRP